MPLTLRDTLLHHRDQIGDPIASADAGHRCNHRVLTTLQQRECGVCAAAHAIYIGIDLRPPGLRLGIYKRAVDADASIVEQQVEAAMMLLYCVEQPRDLFGVPTSADSAVARSLQLRGRL